jgi:hypothetical protein
MNHVILLFIILHMKNIVKSGLGGIFILHATLVSAAIDFEGGTNGAVVSEELKGTTGDLATTIQSFISFLIGFLYLVAVVYALWGGFNILTAGGDEEKVKKGKTIIIQALIGLLVIFLASSIVTFVMTSLFSNAA